MLSSCICSTLVSVCAMNGIPIGPYLPYLRIIDTKIDKPKAPSQTEKVKKKTILKNNSKLKDVK